MFEGFCKNPELRTLCLGAQTITQRLISKFRKILLLMFLWHTVSLRQRNGVKKILNIQNHICHSTAVRQVCPTYSTLFWICTFLSFCFAYSKRKKSTQRKKNQRYCLEFVRIVVRKFSGTRPKNLLLKSYNSMP